MWYFGIIVDIIIYWEIGMFKIIVIIGGGWGIGCVMVVLCV